MTMELARNRGISEAVLCLKSVGVSAVLCPLFLKRLARMNLEPTATEVGMAMTKAVLVVSYTYINATGVLYTGMRP